jgi:hypothetical protein
MKLGPQSCGLIKVNEAIEDRLTMLSEIMMMIRSKVRYLKTV